MTGPTDDHIQKRGTEQGPQDPGGDLPHALATGFTIRLRLKVNGMSGRISCIENLHA